MDFFQQNCKILQDKPYIYIFIHEEKSKRLREISIIYRIDFFLSISPCYVHENTNNEKSHWAPNSAAIEDALTRSAENDQRLYDNWKILVQRE